MLYQNPRRASILEVPKPKTKAKLSSGGYGAIKKKREKGH